MNQALSPDAALCVAEGLMACELGHGLAVLHQDSGTFYILGEIESFIWRQLANPATVGDIANAVKEAYDGPPEEIDRDLGEFLQSMVEASLFKVDITVAA